MKPRRSFSQIQLPQSRALAAAKIFTRCRNILWAVTLPAAPEARRGAECVITYANAPVPPAALLPARFLMPTLASIPKARISSSRREMREREEGRETGQWNSVPLTSDMEVWTGRSKPL